jgi:hypothetical protein
MATKDTLTIEVKPDIGQDPEVHLDDRTALGAGKTRIRWVKAAGAANFDFLAFAPDTAPEKNPFKNISVTKTRIKCDFQPSRTQVHYKYRLSIEHNEIPYDTDDDHNPNHGSAVIRN